MGRINDAHSRFVAFPPHNSSANRDRQSLQGVLVFSNPFDGVSGGLDQFKRNGQEVLPNLRRQRLQLQLQNPLLVGKAVGCIGKIPLGVRRGAHDVLISQGGLLRLGHFLVGFRDPIRHGEGFQVDHRHVNAKLLQRLGLAGDAGSELFKGFRGVQVVEGCHITGEARQGHGHLLHGRLRDAHALEHSAQCGGELLGLKLAFAKGLRCVFGPLVDFCRPFRAEGGVHHVLDLVQVGCNIDSGLAELNDLFHRKS